MDILSREWVSNGDGLSRIEFTRLKIIDFFTLKREKCMRRNPEINLENVDSENIKILDIGSCNGLLADSMEKPYRVESIDIAPANEKVGFADFTGVVWKSLNAFYIDAVF